MANSLISGYDSVQSQAVINNITFQSLNFPNNDDLSGAAAALWRLQEIYLLNTTTVARGEIKGAKMSSELTAGDCFELGRQAYNANQFNHTLHWMKEALKQAGIRSS
uniref:Putative prolyl 4-hydroxylase alpha subunit n=1 Tax=Latrodectus hesperus TaxID=256737 RepID=E7D1P9_LATHE|nr:putative prolyl 4-hydroxylase alpha subunit [Latrodectus hesperus]